MIIMSRHTMYFWPIFPMYFLLGFGSSNNPMVENFISISIEEGTFFVLNPKIGVINVWLCPYFPKLEREK